MSTSTPSLAVGADAPVAPAPRGRFRLLAWSIVILACVAFWTGVALLVVHLL